MTRSFPPHVFRAVLLALAPWLPLRAQDPANFGFLQAQAFLSRYCQKCHRGDTAVGGFRLELLSSDSSLRTGSAKWTAAATRVQNGEMPPKGSPAPSLEERETFSSWVNRTLRQQACANGVSAGPSPVRRLNRDEYAATLRDLLDMQMDVARLLPADGAGGEGFDNAAETLFLSPLHAEKVLEMAKFATNFAAKEFKSREKIFVARPGNGSTETQAASAILESFLPRAFRRPVPPADAAAYFNLFQQARKMGQTFEEAILFSIRGALVSPQFLFHLEPPNTAPEARPIDSYAMASRLSYFLWGSMPDEFLFDIAAAGKLHDREVLRQIVPILLRNDKSLSFAQRFTEQWLHTRELSIDKAPDAKLFPTYAMDEELRGDIRFEPILFFRELLVRNLSLLHLIDSRYTVGTSNLARHYNEKLPVRQNAAKQPQWVELPEGTRRGGVLGMAAVLTVSSYPYRTSPVLRGAWILESILGTPPPPAPPNVPPLDEERNPSAAASVRERLLAHRTNAVCASCHTRIDPWGFALENYDAIGRWREEEAGKPIDASAELPDGTRFQGPAELKRVLLERKDLFIRHLTAKMLGYALGRGLTLSDQCTVDQIAGRLRENDYRAQTLIEEIVWSMPFRYHQAAAGSSRKEETRSKP